MVGRIGKAHSQFCVLACFDADYRLMIKLYDEAGDMVAQCPLPNEFIVNAHGNRVCNGKQRARTPTHQQVVGPSSDLPSVTALGLISPQPPASTEHSQVNSSHTNPVLGRLFPADGPASGGTMIAIHGINFPPPTQQLVYVKFGNVAVLAV